MTDIHAFIEARLDEDERIAVATGHRPDWYVHVADETLRYPQTVRATGIPTLVATTYDGGHENQTRTADHIARHDPARVLLEVEAKRKRLKLHTPEQVPYIDRDGAEKRGPVCEVCGDGGETPGALWPCDTLKTDALPHAYHPDFNPQWQLA